MLAQRRRLWANKSPTLGQRLVFERLQNRWTHGHRTEKLKVWSTVKFRGTRGPQKAIVPVGRPIPYSIIILNMRFIPKASLRASSQITASSYILERHLWVYNSKLLALTPTWSLSCNKLTVLLPECWNCLTQACIAMPSKHKTFVWLYAMLDQRRRRWVDAV